MTSSDNSSQENYIDHASYALAWLSKEVKQVSKEIERSGGNIPDLMKINNLDQIPKVKRDRIEDWLWSIFIYGEYPLKKILGELPSSVREDIGNYKFYLEEYKSISEKICNLLGAFNAPDPIDIEEQVGIIIETREGDADEFEFIKYYREYASRGILTGYFKNPESLPRKKQQIKYFFTNAVDAVKLLYFCISYFEQLTSEVIEPDIHLVDTNKADNLTIEKIAGFGKEVLNESGLHDSVFAESLRDCDADCFPGNIYTKVELNLNSVLKESYFQPDDWVSNKNVLSPFRLSTTPSPDIKKRIHEIHRSFIFGNWMATIALSRCLLEYAIIHREQYLKKKAKEKICFDEYIDGDNKLKGKRTKRLGKLIDAAAKAFPTLKKDMRYINEEGNKIMHPSSKQRENKKTQMEAKFELHQIAPSGKEDAKNCVEKITRIIDALYNE